ncbi:MAG: hypothetical protein WDZ83_20535 [Rhizobiaceae bacterium]
MSDIDLDKYRHHVDRFDLPEEQKKELLKAVWRIMQNFVDRAFGDDPVQHCMMLEGRPHADEARARDSSQAGPPKDGTTRAAAGGKSAAKDESAALSMVDCRDDTTPDNEDRLADTFGREADS